MKVLTKNSAKAHDMTKTTIARKFLKTEKAAEVLNVAPGTLVVWRSTKRYNVPYHKVGGRVLYALDDLLEFLEAARRAETGGTK